MKIFSYTGRLRAFLTGGLILLLGLVSTSCVEDVGLINRTSPDKVDKKLFEGVWLYVATTVDAPYSTALTFTGHTNFGDTAKVIFDVQEKWLVAYPVIEAVEDSEQHHKMTSIRKYWDEDNRDKFAEMYVGQPLARWPITKHFDLNQKYNSYNGAQSNEVVENTSDRPWYQRDYIRVDWASQAVGTFFYGLKKSASTHSYLVSEDKQGHPDSMTMDAEGGYLDYVIRTNVRSLGANYCNIYGLSQYDCAPAEVKVRHAFRRLDPARDYEPLRYHNNEHQDKFGYFLTERYAYHPDWGPTYEGKVSWANRWNLWTQNFDYIKPVDADGNEVTVSCFKDSDCDREAGQRCQKSAGWFDDGYCAVAEPRPYTQRVLKPIVYHVNADWHPDYMGGAYGTADSWNDTFRDSAAWRIFYDEKDQAKVRSCESHADCTTDSLLADATVRVRGPGVPCHTDNECSVANAFCGGAGYCVINRACDASNPCAVGQTCSSGECKDAEGNTATLNAPNLAVMGGTVVYHGDGTVVTQDLFPNHMLSVFSSKPNDTFVRFVNADPEGGDIGLQVGDVTLAGGSYDAARDYDPADPATADFISTVAAGNNVTIKVTKNGSVVAETTGSLVAKSSYLVIYNGNDILIAGSAFNEVTNGIRFVHAASGQGKVDFAIEGVRIGEDLTYSSVTDYQNISGDVQRTTVSTSGARGDHTCYMDEAIGRCVGWGADFTDADQARWDEIRNNIPNLYVVCENQYNALEAGDQQAMEQGMDFHGNARYSLTEARLKEMQEVTGMQYPADPSQVKNGFYNPCGDPNLVAHPEEPKKIGDTRYSLMNWVNEAMRAGPLGYGPSAADPHTGELIYAIANIYGSAIHTYSQYAADLIDLVNGDLDPSDVITGNKVREFVAAKKSDPNPEIASHFGKVDDSESFEGGLSDAHSGHNHHGAHNHLLNGPKNHNLTYGNATIGKNGMIKSLTRPKHDYEFPELNEYQRNPAKFKEDLETMMPAVEPGFYQKRLEKVKGTFVEDLMINNEMKLAAPFVDPEGKLSPTELKDAISPINWATKYKLKQEQDRITLLAKENIYMAEFADDALYGLAKEMKAMGLAGDDLRMEIGRRILKGVLEHEVGHTVGLRHNFSGSTDVFNFFDEYYDVREKERILCQSDGWCDEMGGALCTLSKCNSDGDCLPGLACVPNENDVLYCSAPDKPVGGVLVPTGVCAKAVENQSCTTDAQCAEGDVCSDTGLCYRPEESFVPRSWQTDKERAEKRIEYQYTSIMDYGGRFNSDFMGLGKYDEAAIRFAYAGVVDTYANDKKLRDRVENAAALTGNNPFYYSYFLNTNFWSNRGTGFWHAFNYLGNYIGVEENLDRLPRPYEQIKYQRQMVNNDVRGVYDVAHIEVPYAMCSDEYRGNMGCYLFDIGIDPGEIANHSLVLLEQYYIFDAFKRERLNYGAYGNPMSYFGRIMGRYFNVLGDVGMYYALWDNFLFRYSWYQEWKDMPLGGRTLDRAARESFGYLRDTIAGPSPGCFKLDETQNAYVNTSWEEGDDCDLNVPFGVGRYPHTQFGDALGYNFYQHPLWFGSFWEKMAALMTLTDSTAYFVDTAVGEQLNIGVGTSLGYNTVYSEELNNLLGGIISGDLDYYAGRVVQGAYVSPSIPGDENGDTRVVPSLNNFNLKLYAAVFGLAYLPAGFDPQFIDRLAVFVDGEASQFEHLNAPGVEEHAFEDPISGKTYLAYSTNYGAYGEDKVETAVRLVNEATTVAAEWQESKGEQRAQLEKKLHNIRETLDLLRSLHHIYGTSVLGF